MTEAEQTKYRAQFRGLVDALTTFKADALLRADKEVNFSDSEPLFRRINSFFELAKSVHWENVPAARLHALLDPLDSLKRKLDEIKNFSGAHGEPVRIRDAAATQLEGEFNKTYTELVPHLSFELITGTSSVITQFQAAGDRTIQNLENGLVEVQNAIADGKKMVTDVAADLGKDQGRAKQILAAIESDAKRIGVTNQAGHFKKLADDYSTGAKKWLFAASGFAVLLVGFLLCLAAKPVASTATTNSTNAVQTATAVSSNLPIATNASTTPSPSTQPVPSTSVDLFRLIEAWLPRLLIISLILTGLIFSLRNFAAQSHNRVVNLHRQTALSSFQTFVTSTADDSTKNTVLVQATQAIFAPQPSGYLKSENEVSQLPQISLITDLVRSGGKPDKA